MYAQCPECLTVFKLAGADLAAAHGSVRCGYCEAVFDALRTLAEQLPSEPIEQLDTHPILPLPPSLEFPVFRPTPAQAPLFIEPFERARNAELSSSPGFAAARRRARQPRSARWLAGSAVLLLVLGAQIAWAERARWIDQGYARRWLDAACATLTCTLPLRRDAATLNLLSRDIRPHPSVPGALIISATLRNDATFAQPYPSVEIVLSDLDENRVAMRRFQPREYLGDTRAVGSGLGAGASASLVFEVADPGRNAVAFEFKFD